MNPKQITVLLSKSIQAKKPVLITGAPGIGKTDVVKKAAKDAGANLIITHPCVSDPTDFKGLPALVDGKAEFLPFGDLVKLMEADSLTVCFFDDIGQAPPAVQAALMQLLLAREINGKKISDHVTFIAATNRKQDKAGVSGMLEPVKSRFACIVEMKVDHKSWIEWAIDSGLPIELISFIQFRPNLLHDFKASSDLINSPCPRTVANLASLVSMDLPKEMQLESFAGAVGEGFATEFLAFLPIMKKLPNIDNVLMGNVVEPPKEIDVSFAVAVALSRKTTEGNITNAFNYVSKMPIEFQVLYVKATTKNNPELCNTREYITWNSKNSDYIA